MEEHVSHTSEGEEKGRGMEENVWYIAEGEAKQ